MAQPVPLRVPQSQSLPLEEPAEDRLIVALDQNTDANRRLITTLGSTVSFYKMGFTSLLANGGSALLEELLESGKSIFLDIKIHEIPQQVFGTVQTITTMRGVRFTTVHGSHAVIEKAIEARGTSPLKILAITALTHLTEVEMRHIYNFPSDVTLEQHVLNMARQLIEYGCDGVITSPWEVEVLRQAFPQGVILVAPGIRMEGDPSHDQRRTGKPFNSIKAGADYLVVGRSISENPDPERRTLEYILEIERGLEARE